MRAGARTDTDKYGFVLSETVYTDGADSSLRELELLPEGFKSPVKIGVHFCQSRIQRMKEAATPDQNLSCIPEAVQTN